MSSLGNQIRQFLGLQPQNDQHHGRLSLEESDNSLLVGAWQAGESQRDRLTYDRQEVLADCMDAWRFNPLARRVTELPRLMSQGVDSW